MAMIDYKKRFYIQGDKQREQAFKIALLHVVFQQYRTREETYRRNCKELALFLERLISGSGVFD